MRDYREKISCLLNTCITDLSLRNSAQALRCQEPEDLLKYLVIQQPLIQSESISKTQKKRGYTDRFENNFLRSRVIRCYSCGKEGHTSNKCNKIKREKPEENSIKCFNCNEEGHRFIRCPKMISKCNLCKKVGHIDEQCNRGSSSMIANSKGENKITCIDYNNSSEKYYKDVLINGKTYRAYADFGRACTLIKLSEAKKLELPKNFQDFL